jgi:hypothetical protein
MGKKPIQPDLVYRPDPGRVHPPVDERVKLPRQVEHAAVAANARATGQPVPPKPKPEAQPGFPHSEAEIDQALRRLEKGTMQISDPDFDVIRHLAEVGAQHMKAVRTGAQKPRKKSDEVTQRLRALLSSYQGLSPKLQNHPTGTTTVRALRRSIVKKLGLRDDEVTEDMILSDMRQVRPLMRLIGAGKIPHSFFFWK